MTSGSSESENNPPRKKSFAFFDRFKKKSAHVQHSGLEASKQKMIKGVIGLSDKIVKEIMIPRVDTVAVSSDISLSSLLKVVSAAGNSRIPVYKETIDVVVGILHVKDLLKFIQEKPKNFQVNKILRKPFFVPETMSLSDLLLDFKRQKLHMAVVVDEYGGVSGIITLEDILEEIVGDIEDEFDDEPPEFLKIGENKYEIDSRMTIADLNEKTGLSLSPQDFDTIGGFILDLFGKVPKKNEIIKYNNLTFKIKNIKGTRIKKIILTVNTE